LLKRERLFNIASGIASSAFLSIELSLLEEDWIYQISVRASSKKLIEWIAYPLRLTMRLELALTEMISKAPLGSI